MSKRTRCARCERPIKTCLCADLVELSCDYQLIILQDPKEAKHALSSAPILEKSIVGAQRVIGEVFDPVVLLGADWQSNSLLIYPHEKSLNQQQALARNFKHLIILDGTWRKVARMLHLNPWLNELPCYAIDSSYESQYLIRKSPRADGLSTIEAAVIVLNDLHSSSTKNDQEKNDQGKNVQTFDSILGAFNKMIEFQISAMGSDTFNKNYSSSKNDSS